MIKNCGTAVAEGLLFLEIIQHGLEYLRLTQVSYVPRLCEYSMSKAFPIAWGHKR